MERPRSGPGAGNTGCGAGPTLNSHEGADDGQEYPGTRPRRQGDPHFRREDHTADVCGPCPFNPHSRVTARDGVAAVSDGTMPCPVPSPDTGHPCIKKIPAGWTAEEGHAGGHWWQDPTITELEKRGVHFNYSRLLSGQPTKWHEPEDCTPACWKWRGAR